MIIPIGLKLPNDRPIVTLDCQIRRLDQVKEQLQDMQTQLATLSGVVDNVMDCLYDIKEKIAEDK